VAKPRKGAVAVGDLLGPALKALGMPSARLTGRVLAAWQQIADPAWAEQVIPRAFTGGVLVLGVSSSSLRQELAQFHRERLLNVMQVALPDVSLVGLRFTTESAAPAGEDVSADGEK
jgi:hypothetical protein